MTVEVRRITSTATHDLRRRVLRNGTPSQDVTYPQDDLPGTIHLGAFLVDDTTPGEHGGEAAAASGPPGTLIGVASWAVERRAEQPDVPAVRLRGMAVDTVRQGSGFGVALVDAGIAWALEQGAELVWASARDAVLGFYERCGFTVVGEGFVDAATALPHHMVVRALPPVRVR